MRDNKYLPRRFFIDLAVGIAISTIVAGASSLSYSCVLRNTLENKRALMIQSENNRRGAFREVLGKIPTLDGIPGISNGDWEKAYRDFLGREFSPDLDNPADLPYVDLRRIKNGISERKE